jgi:transcriptional regulator with XRE-family HTH domain
LLGRNVRQVRNHRRLSQEALADLAGVDRTYVSGIERKGRNVSIHTVQLLSEALQIDPHLLLDPSLTTNPEFGGEQLFGSGPEAATAALAASHPTRRR